MNEVSTVGTLIKKLIVFAIALGAAGTLIDSIADVRGKAEGAIRRNQISYEAWNKTLLKRK